MFESINNVLDVLFTICFYRYLQFHFMKTVKVFELIMIKFNNVCICIRQHLRYRNQLTWFIRKVNGEGKDTATQYETFINHGRNS